jgi:hypothetical protein
MPYNNRGDTEAMWSDIKDVQIRLNSELRTLAPQLFLTVEIGSVHEMKCFL